MKWNKYTIETTTAAEDYMSAMLADLGIEGVEIEDNIPLSKEDQADMFIDFLPELPPDDGVSHVSFYLEDDGEDRTVDTHVKMLRGHLGKCRSYIATVWGIGYKFDPDAAR